MAVPTLSYKGANNPYISQLVSFDSILVVIFNVLDVESLSKTDSLGKDRQHIIWLV